MSLIINLHYGQIVEQAEDEGSLFVYHLSPFKHTQDGQCPSWMEESFGQFVKNGIEITDYKGNDKQLNGEWVSRSLALIGLVEQIKLLKTTARILEDTFDGDTRVILNVAKSGLLGRYLLRFIAGQANQYVKLRFIGFPNTWAEGLRTLPSYNEVYKNLLVNKKVVFGETLEAPIEFEPHNYKGKKYKPQHTDEAVHESDVQEQNEIQPAHLTEAYDKKHPSLEEEISEEDENEVNGNTEVEEEVVTPPKRPTTKKRTSTAKAATEDDLNKLAEVFPVKSTRSKK
jgi:hypothetical protein